MFHQNLGITFRTMHRYDEAIAEYLTATQLNPHEAGAVFDLAVCYEQTNRRELAVETYQRYARMVEARDPAAAQRARDAATAAGR